MYIYIYKGISLRIQIIRSERRQSLFRQCMLQIMGVEKLVDNLVESFSTETTMMVMVGTKTTVKTTMQIRTRTAVRTRLKLVLAR